MLTLRLVERLGAILFGLSCVVFGVQHFLYSGYLAGLEFVPEGIPAHTFWAYSVGLCLLAAGLSFAFGKGTHVTALLLGLGLLVCTLLLAPKAIARPADLRERTRIVEMLALCGTAWLWAGRNTQADSSGHDGDIRIQISWIPILGQWLLSACLVIFGVDHLEIPGFIASLIPAWIPFRLFWAYFTGFALVGAGFSFGIRKWTRPTGLLLGLMFLLWVAVLHAPRVLGALHNGNEWNSAFVAVAMAGAAFGVASQRTKSVPRLMDIESPSLEQVAN